jgi:hypothetical protein
MSEESLCNQSELRVAIKMPKFAKTTVKEFEKERKELVEEVLQR